MPTSLERLSPNVAGDSNARLWSTIQDLSSRVTALERHRDLIITPFRLDIFGGSPTPSTTFTWHGGKLWLMAGGVIQDALGGPANIGVILAVGSEIDTADFIVAPSVNGNNTALPFIAKVLNPVYLSPTTSINAARAFGNTTANANVNGAMIEWPSA